MSVTNRAVARPAGWGLPPRLFSARRQFRPGVEVVAELVGLDQAVQGADLVITGEGRFDAQTLRGKTPFGVARIAQRHGVPVIVLAGTLGEGYEQMYQHGPMSLEQACADAAVLLSARARDIARVWRLAAAR